MNKKSPLFKSKFFFVDQQRTQYREGKLKSYFGW